jgi:hypothetical protein
MSDAEATANDTPTAPTPADPPAESPAAPDWQRYAILSQAAYTRAKPVDGYTIDPQFSDRNRTLYVDDNTGKAILAFRGTKLSGEPKSKWADLGADALIALGLQDLSARFRGARRATKQVITKYGKDNVVVTGHSLGGSEALYVHHRLFDKPEAHAFNAGISPVDVLRSKGIFGPEQVRSLFNKVPVWGKNVHHYITKGDIISSLSPHIKGLTTHTVPMKGSRNPHALRHFLP